MLAERAKRTARALGMPQASDPVAPASASDKLLASLSAAPPAWEMRPGMRLGFIRRLILRLLAPFSERQHQVDAEVIASLHMLAERVRRLEAGAAIDAEADRAVREIEREP